MAANFFKKLFKVKGGAEHQLPPGILSGCPRDLEELLSEFDSPGGEGVDRRIASSPWCSKFSWFLEDRQFDDEVLALRFLVHLQPHLGALRRAASGGSGGDTALRGVFLSAREHFFSPRSHLVVDDGLSAAVRNAAISSSDGLSPEHATLLLRARSDSNVWLNGLHPQFVSFQQREGKASTADAMKACLLCIM